MAGAHSPEFLAIGTCNWVKSCLPTRSTTVERFWCPLLWRLVRSCELRLFALETTMEQPRPVFPRATGGSPVGGVVQSRS